MDIGVNEEVVRLYREWRIKKNRAYIILTIAGGEVTVESLGDLLPDDAYSVEKCKEVFETLKAGLKTEEPKHFLFAAKCKNEWRSTTRDLVLITWCSDSVSVRQKMSFSSTKETLMEKFPDAVAMQANNVDEFDFDKMVQTLRRK